MMLDPFGRCADALRAHAAMAPGRVVRLPAAVPDPDEFESPDTHRSRVRHERQAEHRRALGLSKSQYRAARRAGTLPQWCYARPDREARA